MKILVVDDDPVVLRSCQRILGAAGIEAQLSESVAKALARMSRERFDVLLVDIKMPEKDGFAVAKEAVRRNDGVTPFIVMTGYPTPGTRARSKELGAAGFVPKPFTPDELLAAIHGTGGSHDGCS
jgi:DNA-binding response OmpR family regulator